MDPCLHKFKKTTATIRYMYIQGYATLSSGQTIATFQSNISQHCWPSICKSRLNVRIDATLLGVTFCKPRALGNAVARCCDMLGVENRTSAHARGATLLQEPGQTTTTCNNHKCCMKNLTIFKFEPTAPNTLQHVAKGWPNACNMLHSTMLR